MTYVGVAGCDSEYCPEYNDSDCPDFSHEGWTVDMFHAADDNFCVTVTYTATNVVTVEQGQMCFHEGCDFFIEEVDKIKARYGITTPTYV